METKVNTGAIFKNDKKQGKQPDYRGKVNVNGKEMEIALWLKESWVWGATKIFVSIRLERRLQPAYTT